MYERRQTEKAVTGRRTFSPESVTKNLAGRVGWKRTINPEVVTEIETVQYKSATVSEEKCTGQATLKDWAKELVPCFSFGTCTRIPLEHTDRQNRKMSDSKFYLVPWIDLTVDSRSRD